jgi:hypothetical protein
VVWCGVMVGGPGQVILGVHGGALPIQSVFMQEGTHVVELVDLTRRDMLPYCCLPYHGYLAEALDLKYWMVKGGGREWLKACRSVGMCGHGLVCGACVLCMLGCVDGMWVG